MTADTIKNSEIRLRGIIFCPNAKCGEAYISHFVLLEKKWDFNCMKCRGRNTLVLEEHDFTLGTKVFRQVRVEWEYDTKTATYRNVVMLTDDTMDPAAGVYTFRCPLVKTSIRAERLALGILSHLQKHGSAMSDGRLAPETVLNFADDRSTFEKKCFALAELLAKSNLAEGRTQAA